MGKGGWDCIFSKFPGDAGRVDHTLRTSRFSTACYWQSTPWGMGSGLPNRQPLGSLWGKPFDGLLQGDPISHEKPGAMKVRTNSGASSDHPRFSLDLFLKPTSTALTLGARGEPSSRISTCMIWSSPEKCLKFESGFWLSIYCFLWSFPWVGEGRSNMIDPLFKWEKTTRRGSEKGTHLIAHKTRMKNHFSILTSLIFPCSNSLPFWVLSEWV